MRRSEGRERRSRPGRGRPAGPFHRRAPPPQPAPRDRPSRTRVSAPKSCTDESVLDPQQCGGALRRARDEELPRQPLDAGAGKKRRAGLGRPGPGLSRFHLGDRGERARALPSALGRGVGKGQQAKEGSSTTSNLFRNPNQGELARRLVSRAPPTGRVFFCNSGAEANEGLTWRSPRRTASGRAARRGTATRSSARPMPSVLSGPSAKGARRRRRRSRRASAPWSLASLSARLTTCRASPTWSTTAPRPFSSRRSRGKGACRPSARSSSLDSCGSATRRTCCSSSTRCSAASAGPAPSTPTSTLGSGLDAIGMPGQGPGRWVSHRGASGWGEVRAELFQPGSHGTTFGGTPLACAASLAVLDVMEREQLLAHVTSAARVWLKSLEKLAAGISQAHRRACGASASSSASR